jgi:hypothetical protein
MRIRLDQVDSHVHFTVFINGANAGSLTLRYDEWEWYDSHMQKGFGIQYVLENTQLLTQLHEKHIVPGF